MKLMSMVQIMIAWEEVLITITMKKKVELVLELRNLPQR